MALELILVLKHIFKAKNHECQDYFILPIISANLGT